MSENGISCRRNLGNVTLEYVHWDIFFFSVFTIILLLGVFK